MSNTARAIENCEALSTLSLEVRAAALHGEWDQLANIQQQREAVVVAMKTTDPAATLDEAGSRQKNALIAQILADEAETRDRVKARMAEMDAELKEGRQELRLLREYRKHAG
jgi:phage gp37-like protein